MRASTEECIAVCSAGPDVCLGINWLPLNPEPTRCMLQALAKTPQDAVEAAVGAKMNWWWAQGTATEGPPVKAVDHGNGDWTASASCWVRASFATGGGLGWSFVLLLLLSAAGYLSVGAALARRGGRGQRWPHEPFWRELRALVAEGACGHKRVLGLGASVHRLQVVHVKVEGPRRRGGKQLVQRCHAAMAVDPKKILSAIFPPGGTSAEKRSCPSTGFPPSFRQAALWRKPGGQNDLRTISR